MFRNKTPLVVLTFFLGLIRLSPNVFAAPCCGGGTALPSLITTDDKALWSVSVGGAQEVGSVSGTGSAVFHDAFDQSLTSTLTIDGATLLSDRWQLGVSIPFLYRNQKEGSARASDHGLGDVSLSGAYEALPEWGYSAWIPKVFLFTKVIFPTGVPVYEKVFSNDVSITSRSGLWTFGFGGVAVKTWTQWDTSLLLEAERGVNREFTVADLGTTRYVQTGWATRVQWGVGWSPPASSLRVGVRLRPQWNEGRSISENSVTTTMGDRWVNDVGVDVAWKFTDLVSATLSYTDQTLLGPAQNTTLDRSFGLTVTARWPR